MEKASYRNGRGQGRLRIAAWALTLFCVGLMFAGWAVDTNGSLNLLSRMGSVVVAVVVTFFFFMELTGYLTYEPSNDVFNPNHGVQRSYLARFEGPLLIAGTLINGWGDWLTNLLNCGGVKC